MPTLAEELCLLALHDEKGYIIPSARISLRFGLAGAVLMELVLLNKIEVRNKKVVVVDASSTNDEIFDTVLQKLSSSKKNRPVSSWMLRFNTSRLSRSILDRLIARKILYKVDRKILWVIPSSRYPTRDGREEKVIRELIRSVLLRNRPLDQHITLLINLMHACDLTGELFTREEKKLVKKRIKEIIKKEVINQSIEAIKKYMIDAINSASMPGD